MRENRTSGSEGGEAQTNELSLPLSLCRLVNSSQCGRTLRGPNPNQPLRAMTNRAIIMVSSATFMRRGDFPSTPSHSPAITPRK